MYSRTEDASKLLVDLKKDPLERKNLASSDDRKDMIDQLDGMLKAHTEEREDDWGIEAVFPPPNFQTHGEGDTYFKKLFEEAILEE